MPYLVVNSGRMIQKIITNTGTPFAVAPSVNHTDGTWSPYHLYDGEIGLNTPLSQFAVRISGAVRYAPLVASLGTSGQFLMSNGAGLLASWATPAGGGGGGSGSTDVFYVALTKVSGSVYTGTATGLTAYTSNAVYFFTFDIAPSSAPITANLNGLGAITFKKPNGSTNLPASAVSIINVVYEFAYNGTSWVPESKIAISETGGISEITVGVTPIISGTTGSIPYNNASGFYQEDSHNMFYNEANQRIGFGTNSPSAKLHLKGLGTTTGTVFLVTNSSPVTFLQIFDDGTTALGYGATNYHPSNTVHGYQAAAANGAVNSVVIGRQAAGGAYAAQIIIGQQATGAGGTNIAIGQYCDVSAANTIAMGYDCDSSSVGAHSFGVNGKASGVGSWIFAFDQNATKTNDIPGSFKFHSASSLGESVNQALLLTGHGNFALDAATDLRASNFTTHIDTVADNVVTLADATTAANTIAVTSVSSSSGALFNHASASTSYRTGDRVVTSGFGVYNNQTYYYGGVSGTSFKLYTTRANALTQTSPVAFISTDTGTVTPQIRTPSAAFTNATQVYSSGGKLSALNADGETGQVTLGVISKKVHLTQADLAPGTPIVVAAGVAGKMYKPVGMCARIVIGALPFASAQHISLGPAASTSQTYFRLNQILTSSANNTWDSEDWVTIGNSPMDVLAEGADLLLFADAGTTDGTGSTVDVYILYQVITL